MNKQLNIPINLLQTIDPIHLISNIENQLNSEMAHNICRLKNKKVIFNRNSNNELKPIHGWDIKTPELESKIFKPSTKQITVAGIDSSCIQVAETDVGSVYAGRAAVVFSQNGKISKYIRIGPIIYYMDEINASKLSFEISGSDRLKKLFLLDKSLAQQIIREKLERNIALELTKMLSNSIIMIDGCLRYSKFEERKSNLRRLIELANENNNIIIGLSKVTRIGILNNISQVLYNSRNTPAYLNVNEFIPPFLSYTKSQILLVRFSNDGHPYRIDIPSSNIEESLSLLISSDSFYHGYPETLKMAHHFSIFTGTQSDSIKSYLVKNIGVLEIPSENIRYASLGSMSFRISH